VISTVELLAGFERARADETSKINKRTPSTDQLMDFFNEG
jgi:hypothetical protein